MTTAELPLDEWRLLLSALCAGSPAWLGTLGPPEGFQLIEPTRFAWLRRALWSPPADARASGVALLELADPGTVPASAWEPLCGGLTQAPATIEGRIRFGEFDAPSTGRSATITLVTGWDDDPADALVRAVRIRTDPV